jgi:hypothetical protein
MPDRTWIFSGEWAEFGFLHLKVRDLKMPAKRAYLFVVPVKSDNAKPMSPTGVLLEGGLLDSFACLNKGCRFILDYIEKRLYKVETRGPEED